ncbi:hypothetical protein C6P40_005037 [Pichia californica]|uniref:Mitochondrial K+-H+ exchange-related-domain-containing protein n=1 Tax=Pichia californica TaxID=460514 RepID=A0A9P6WRL6_9ASCO|nr:hypothetical protein C6P42_004024 [[Candida] californica]KAG0691118.1 hypothetical protein C6P40_005037 [[Candida] californica]
MNILRTGRIGIRVFQSQARTRYLSTTATATATETETAPILNNKRIYFYVLPLTTKKTFIHCKYNDSVFPNGQKNLEEKIINKFTTLWKNFSEADSKINKTITTNINKILAKIPWLETCLLSIPSQKFVTRKLKEDYITHEEITEKKLKAEDLEKIDFYYPKSMTNIELILQNFKPEFKKEYDLHKKGILKDLLFLPLTIPFAIIPLIPNIPGFYLLYRVYCHIKVIASLKYLITLLKDGHFNYNGDSLNDKITETLLSTKDEKIRQNVIEELSFIKEGNYEGNLNRDEKLLISEDVAQELCKQLGDEESANKLLFAIRQERKLQSSADTSDNQ